MKDLYILDVSGFIFRAYFALPPMSNPQGQATHALFGFIRSVVKLFKDFAPENIVAVFDGPDNKKQRAEIYEKYKMHRERVANDLPEQIILAKKFCALIGITEIEVPGVEADDTMGSIAKWAAKEGMRVFLCTSDKDLAQLVDDHVFLLNPWKENLIIDRKKVEEIYGVPPEKIVDLLAIMGDASDNIPGLSGFGPKTAIQLLQKFGSLQEILDNPEKVEGKKKQETLLQERELALLSQRLATIYTDIPFPKEKDLFAKKKVNIEDLTLFYREMAFSTLLKEMDAAFAEEPSSKAKKQEEQKHYYVIEDEEALDTLIQKLEGATEIAIDTETTSLKFMEAEIVGIGFCIQEGEGYYIPFNHTLSPQEILRKLKPLLENKKLLFFGHNLKYDLHILLNVGICIANVSFDTLLASYLLQSSSRRHSLDELSLQHFGKVKMPIKDLIGVGKKEISMKEVEIQKVANYCCEDVDYTFRLKKVLEKKLDQNPKLKALFYELELPLMGVLMLMEHHGIYVDKEQLQKMSYELNRSIHAVKEEIFTLAGEEFNISSPKQLSVILFEKLRIKPLKKTKQGFSTDADVLETLAKEHPIAEKILSYRTLEKLRSTYIDSLPFDINPQTQRIHPTFNQSGTTTGRLSCQDPNLQNIPVRTEGGKRIREAFCPEKKGWKFLACDYSQIELRLLAHLSGDKILIDAFNQGEDIHKHTAALMFNVSLPEVTPLMRFQAKAINFGIIYGQQAYGLSQELGIDIPLASRFIEEYFSRYPTVLDFITLSIEMAKKTGKTVTLLGREREIPEITSTNAILRHAAERLAINTPLQGSSADLIKIAMLKIDQEIAKKELKSFLVLQVHDELIFEVPDHEVEILAPLVKKEMENVFPLKVPLLVDVIVGKNWGEC